MKNSIKIIIASILVISLSFITGYMVNSNLPNNNDDCNNTDDDTNNIDDLYEKKYYFAINDIHISRTMSNPIAYDWYMSYYVYNETYLRCIGGHTEAGNYPQSMAMLRFNLSNQPSNYNSCEIMLYKYESSRQSNSVSFTLDLFEGDWNNTNGNTIVYWKIERKIQINYSLGFQKFNITNYIGNNETISIRITTWTTGWQGSINILSSEWRGNNPMLPYVIEGEEYKEYLPQLIWS